MKRIDVDGIISVMKQQAGCATCDNYNGIRCRACQWDDAITSVYDYADYHTVDAIPIEFIQKRINHLHDLAEYDFEANGGYIGEAHLAEYELENLLTDWRTEQEKQNENDGCR